MMKFKKIFSQKRMIKMDNQMVNIVSGLVVLNFVDVQISKNTGKEFSKRYVSIMLDGTNIVFQFVVGWNIKERPEIAIGQRLVGKWTITQFGNNNIKWTTAELIDYEIMSDQTQENVQPGTTPEQTYPAGTQAPTPPTMQGEAIKESDFDFTQAPA
jgi:hypothetical protein